MSEFGGGDVTDVGTLGGIRRGKESNWVVTAKYECQTTADLHQTTKIVLLLLANKYKVSIHV